MFSTGMIIGALLGAVATVVICGVMLVVKDDAKVGDKIKITDRFSTFGGEVLTVQREDGKGRFVCTTPKHPKGEYIAYSRDNGRFWVYAKEG